MCEASDRAVNQWRYESRDLAQFRRKLLAWMKCWSNCRATGAGNSLANTGYEAGLSCAGIMVEGRYCFFVL